MQVNLLQLSRIKPKNVIVLLVCPLLLASLVAIPAQSQSKFDRNRGKEMLDTIKEDIQQYYYDRNFHGMDLNVRFRAAHEKLETATTNSQVFSIIAQAVVDLNDSHTFFLPPDRVVSFDYGWRVQIIGETPYIVAVKPGSEAEAKGLRVGDVVYSIDGFAPTRENLWKIEYSYYLLKPRAIVHLVLENPDGSLRELALNTKVLEPDIRALFGQKKTSALREIQYYEQSEKLIVCKMPTFILQEKEIDEMMKKIKGHDALILDLRRNSGGYEIALKRLLGYLFDRDIKIGDLIQRNGHKTLSVKSMGANVFKGQLVVLVDSKSASASELFARVMQLEKRGTVIGDQTAGAVMRARAYGHSYQRGPEAMMWLSTYGISITEADIVMADGKGLERIGVTPDEVLLPKAVDLGAARDPVLSRAAAILGVKIDPKKAGSLYPTDRTTEVTLEEKPEEQP
jgi:carboxyl-terminal processing protease